MKKMMIMMCCLLLWSEAGIAGCTTTIPESTPTLSFVDNGDGTLVHSKTGLMWKQCREGWSGADCLTGALVVSTWQGALQAAQALNAAGGFAGYTDWRLPNLKELDSILEYRCILPAVNSAVFPATVGGLYWTSTPSPYSAAKAYAVNFSNSSEGSDSMLNTHTVRLVRGGP